MNVRLGFIRRQNNQTYGMTTNSVFLGKLRNTSDSLIRIYNNQNKCNNCNKIHKICVNYTHIDTANNISITNTSNPKILLISHKFDLENTVPNSKFFTSATVYFDDNINTNINNMNTIKIANKGCISYSIPCFLVNNNNYYINKKEYNPIVSEITSSSGEFAGIKGHVETRFIKNKSYITIIYRR